ncbi:hypothetical protein PCO31010_01582 [Pandoraea commovens]|uniref:Uncharacterized protein n=1 Tax=Pandoraea commovens TaxID=2508289 RepID=A0A5E4TV24_9BURK|nr:hypothetical protein PCO31010_01582 [Pandoraea commovens]
MQKHIRHYLFILMDSGRKEGMSRMLRHIFRK